MRLGNVLYTAVVIALAASSPVMAQDKPQQGQNSGEYQKQMMNTMKQQYFLNMQTGQKQLPANISTEAVGQGKAIFNDPSLGTNGKNCGNCHPEGKAPLDGTQPDNYTAAAIQYCYEHNLQGQNINLQGQNIIDK